MSDEYVPAGPVCDFCEQEDAIGSLMNLADYQTMKFGPNCGPAYLLSVVEAMAGGAPADSEPAAAPDPTATGQPAPTSDSAGDSEKSAGSGEQDQDGAGFPGTANVVRSTHGHRRKTETAAADPAAGPAS
jgi:hypothetical protein